MKQVKKTRVVPAFPTEAAEAEWWYKNRRKLAKDSLRKEAAKAGEAPLSSPEKLLLTRTKLRRRRQNSISIRVAESPILES